jgi:hypothetical protein
LLYVASSGHLAGDVHTGSYHYAPQNLERAGESISARLKKENKMMLRTIMVAYDGGRMMDNRYPELEHRRHILRAIYQRLEQAYNRGESVLILQPDEVPELGEELGFVPAKTYAKVKELIDEGYLRARLAPGAFGQLRYSLLTVESLTDRGLFEIGAIPDPRQRLIQGFEGTISEIEADPQLDEQEKRKRIDLAREAIAFVRGLSVEIAARIITVELPPR